MTVAVWPASLYSQINSLSWAFATIATKARTDDSRNFFIIDFLIIINVGAKIQKRNKTTK
jgi:hypothetical protein